MGWLDAVQVFVRVRPTNATESAEGEFLALYTQPSYSSSNECTWTGPKLTNALVLTSSHADSASLRTHTARHAVLLI